MFIHLDMYDNKVTGSLGVKYVFFFIVILSLNNNVEYFIWDILAERHNDFFDNN